MPLATRIIDGQEYRKENFIARDGIDEIRQGWFRLPNGRLGEVIPVGDYLDLVGYFLWDKERQIMYQPNYSAKELPKQHIYFITGEEWLDAKI